MRLLSWRPSLGGDKITTDNYKILAEAQSMSPGKESRLVAKPKRKRSDSDEMQLIDSPNKKHITTTNALLPTYTSDLPLSLQLAPTLTAPSNHSASPADHPISVKHSMAPEQEDLLPPSGTSVSNPALTESQKRAVRRTVDSQIGLEILLKHEELRLIDQELAKCQVALEQLRRCSEVPYPVNTISNCVSSGIGPAVRRPGLRSLPDSPAPWGVTDGPYTRHYAKWLIPDSRFDGSDGDNIIRGSAGKIPPMGRSTRGSFFEEGTVTTLSRKQQASKSSGTPGGALPAPTKAGPMILKRKSDGATVRLVCIDCGRHDFGSPQGFINHCRIGHGRSFSSHDAAAEACGEPVELDETGGLIGIEAAITPLATTVHPLIRSARMFQHTSRQVDSRAEATTTKSSRVDKRSMQQGMRKHNLSTDLNTHFNPSLLTPHLSSLVQNKGLGLNLEELVRDARTRTELSDSELEEDDMEVDPPIVQAAHGRHPQVAGTKHPVHSQISPLPSPTLSRIPLASSARHSPSLRGGMGKMLDSAVPQTHRPTYLGRPQYTGVPSLEPSPTNESHQAPSLVDDDGEEAHSPPTSVLSGDEAESVDFEIQDGEHDVHSDVRMSGMHSGFDDQPKAAAPSAGGGPSIRRKGLGSQEEKHVSFTSPSPARATTKQKHGKASKRRRPR